MYRPDPDSRVKRPTNNMEGDARRQLFQRPAESSRASTSQGPQAQSTPLAHRFTSAHRSQKPGKSDQSDMDMRSVRPVLESATSMARRKQKELLRKAYTIIEGDPQDAVMPETSVELPEDVLEEEQREYELQKVLDRAMSMDVHAVQHDPQIVEVVKISLLEEVKKLDDQRWLDEQCEE